MSKRTTQLLFILAGLVASFGGFAVGGGSVASPLSPVILSAEPDFQQSVLVIRGAHFGTSVPTVHLADTTLEVKSASSDQIKATLPADVRPATYRLMVTAKNGRYLVTSEAFNVGLYRRH